MRYAYNEEGGLINGVILFFEKGDTEIAVETFEVINASKQSPTSIVWDGNNPAPSKVLSKLRERNALNSEFLAVRLTVYENELLRECLDFLKDNYPALSSLVDDIESKIFGTPN